MRRSRRPDATSVGAQHWSGGDGGSCALSACGGGGHRLSHRRGIIVLPGAAFRFDMTSSCTLSLRLAYGCIGRRDKQFGLRLEKIGKCPRKCSF